MPCCAENARALHLPAEPVSLYRRLWYCFRSLQLRSTLGTSSRLSGWRNLMGCLSRICATWLTCWTQQQTSKVTSDHLCLSCLCDAVVPLWKDILVCLGIYGELSRYMKFCLEGGKLVVFDRADAQAAGPKILEQHAITFDRSADLRGGTITAGQSSGLQKDAVPPEQGKETAD